MKKWKQVMSLALSAAMMFAVVGCGGGKGENPAPSASASKETESSKAEASQPEGSKEAEAPASGKKYIIATDTTFAPFEFEDKDGNFVGIDMDLIKAIAKDQGFEIDIQVLGFNAALQAVQSGQAEAVIAGMSITDERKETFDFTDPYYDSQVIMGVAADNDAISGYEDLKDQKVAVKTGTEGEKFATSISEQYGFELVYFDDSAVMYEDVKTGNTVACFEDYPVLMYGISQGVGLKTVGDPQAGNSYGIGVAKGKNPDLLKMLNDGLANVKASGEYEEILTKYNAQEQ